MFQRLLYTPVASIFYVVIFGTWFIVAALAVLLTIFYLYTNSAVILGSLWVCIGAAIYVLGTYALVRSFYYRIAAYFLVLFYLVLASSIVWYWGVNTPIGPLFFGLVIVLAGILLTSRYALFAAAASGFILFAIQTATALGWHRPNTSWTSYQSDYGDVAGYCVVFCMLALLSWLYNREMERALAHARQAEAALRRQKATLKLQVKAAVKDLHRVQLEEIHRMYHFSKLGQLGVTLLHDLANNLTALTLEIDGLNDKHAVERARMQQIIRGLDDLVETTRQRLNGKTMVQIFDIAQKISDTVDFLHYKSVQNHVTLSWQPPKGSWKCKGDLESFSQIIGIITNNALDAYCSGPSRADRKVVVDMRPADGHVVISICDWGKGITKRKRKLLFKPHQSSKKSGLGLGLYIAQQIAEMQFGGTIAISPRTDRTEFIITLPCVTPSMQAK